jgi:hypothetical protein
MHLQPHYIHFGGAAKRGYRNFAAFGSDCLDGCVVAIGGDWETRFDDINAQFLEFSGHQDLFLQIHRTTG